MDSWTVKNLTSKNVSENSRSQEIDLPTSLNPPPFPLIPQIELYKEFKEFKSYRQFKSYSELRSYNRFKS